LLLGSKCRIPVLEGHFDQLSRSIHMPWGRNRLAALCRIGLPAIEVGISSFSRPGQNAQRGR